MAKWIDIAAVADVPDGGRLTAWAEHEPVVVFCLAGAYYAIRNVCPHAGKPLGEGERRGRVLVCPYHGFAYDVTNGRNADFPYEEPPCRTFPVQVADGRLYVQVEAPSEGAGAS